MQRAGLRPALPGSSVRLRCPARKGQREAPPTLRARDAGVPPPEDRQRRHCECGLRRTSWDEAWRVDAHADEQGVGVGGWWPRKDNHGKISTWESPWFAVKVTPDYYFTGMLGTSLGVRAWTKAETHEDDGVDGKRTVDRGTRWMTERMSDVGRVSKFSSRWTSFRLSRDQFLSHAAQFSSRSADPFLVSLSYPIFLISVVSE